MLYKNYQRLLNYTVFVVFSLKLCVRVFKLKVKFDFKKIKAQIFSTQRAVKGTNNSISFIHIVPIK